MNAKRATSQKSAVDPSRGSELHKGSPFFLALTAVGVVFGDIGTSPLYTLAVTFAATGQADRGRRAGDHFADPLGAPGNGVAQIRRAGLVRRQRR